MSINQDPKIVTSSSPLVRWLECGHFVPITKTFRLGNKLYSDEPCKSTDFCPICQVEKRVTTEDICISTYKLKVINRP